MICAGNEGGWKISNLMCPRNTLQAVQDSQLLAVHSFKASLWLIPHRNTQCRPGQLTGAEGEKP